MGCALMEGSATRHGGDSYHSMRGQLSHKSSPQVLTGSNFVLQHKPCEALRSVEQVLQPKKYISAVTCYLKGVRRSALNIVLHSRLDACLREVTLPSSHLWPLVPASLQNDAAAAYTVSRATETGKLVSCH